MTVTFFGHRDTPSTIYPLLKQTIVDLITHHDAKRFYVGTNGNFDLMAQRALRELRLEYPNINYFVVLSRMPIEKKFGNCDDSNTLVPTGLENVPPRFGIEHRNRWMLAHCDCVIAYVKSSVGGASKFSTAAEKRGKRVINLAKTNAK